MDAPAGPGSDRIAGLQRQMDQLLAEMAAHRAEFQRAEASGRLWDARQRRYAGELLARGARLYDRLVALRARTTSA
jgi:hypothetical protein